MLVPALTVGVGLVCLYFGARALRMDRALRRLGGRRREEPSHPTDWPAASDDLDESGETIRERGSIERGVVLLVLGACCVLFGVLAV
jgi:hypothetical protein